MIFGYWDIVLIGLFLLGCGLYGYIASQNTEEIQVKFLTDKRKLSKKHLILICFVDGMIFGIFIGYILFVALKS